MSEGNEDKARYAYLDLLAGTLTEHEKNLSELIEKLEVIHETFSKVGKLAESKEPDTKDVKKDSAETLIYMKLKIDRSTEELKQILDSLKD